VTFWFTLSIKFLQNVVVTSFVYKTSAQLAIVDRAKIEFHGWKHFFNNFVHYIKFSVASEH